MVRFPERHPLLSLYGRMGTTAILLGALFMSSGFLVSQHAPRLITALHLTHDDFKVIGSPKYWIAWLVLFCAGYGKAMGGFLVVFGLLCWLYRWIITKDTLFGDRIRREYPYRR